MRTEETKALAAELRAIESRSKGPLLKRAADMLEELADPVHAAGGAYCYECKRNLFGYCGKNGLRPVEPNSFCSDGVGMGGKMEKLVDEYCEGCVHLTYLDGMGEAKTPACYYIINTGKKRPCPPGKGCTEKIIGKRGPVAP